MDVRAVVEAYFEREVLFRQVKSGRIRSVSRVRDDVPRPERIPVRWSADYQGGWGADLNDDGRGAGLMRSVANREINNERALVIINFGRVSLRAGRAIAEIPKKSQRIAVRISAPRRAEVYGQGRETAGDVG